MSLVSVFRKTVFAVAVLVVVGGAFAKTEPTHYFFVPTARVNQPGDLVLGLHEISYALQGNLQLQLSLLDNIGRLCVAGKYGFYDGFAIGVGYASTLIRGDLLGEAGHGILEDDSRLGMFLAWDIQSRKHYGLIVTGHSQLGNSNFSLGADIGVRVTPASTWSLIGEAGLSAALKGGKGLWIYGAGGIRIHLPQVPGLFIDLGLYSGESNLKSLDLPPGLFFDVMYCFKP